MIKNFLTFFFCRFIPNIPINLISKSVLLIHLHLALKNPHYDQLSNHAITVFHASTINDHILLTNQLKKLIVLVYKLVIKSMVQFHALTTVVDTDPSH